jgi:hypothetical protein
VLTAFGGHYPMTAYTKLKTLSRPCAKHLRELDRLGALHSQKMRREVYFIN